MNLKNRLNRLARSRQELPPLVILPDLTKEQMRQIQKESKARYGLPSLIITTCSTPDPDEKKATSA